MAKKHADDEHEETTKLAPGWIPEPAGVGIISRRTNDIVTAYLAEHNEAELSQEDKETLRVLAMHEAIRGYVPQR